MNFLIDVLEKESPRNLLIISSKPQGKFLLIIQHLPIEIIDIHPSISSNLLEENYYDITIIFQDAALDKAQLGSLKNKFSKSIILLRNNSENNGKYLQLGFSPVKYEEESMLCLIYNLKNYNAKRNWNNPDGWANPENFNRFRW